MVKKDFIPENIIKFFIKFKNFKVIEENRQKETNKINKQDDESKAYSDFPISSPSFLKQSKFQSNLPRISLSEKLNKGIKYLLNQILMLIFNDFLKIKSKNILFNEKKVKK